MATNEFVLLSIKVYVEMKRYHFHSCLGLDDFLLIMSVGEPVISLKCTFFGDCGIITVKQKNVILLKRQKLASINSKIKEKSVAQRMVYYPF